MRLLPVLILFLTFAPLPARSVIITSARIGYVDIERVFEKLESVKKSRAGIMEMMEAERRNIEAGESAVESMKERLEIQEEMLSPEESEELRSMITRHQSQMRVLMEDSRRRILDKEQELKFRILGEIYEAVKSIAEEKGFTVILEKDTVLFSQESVEDITSNVLRRLNESYK